MSGAIATAVVSGVAGAVVSSVLAPDTNTSIPSPASPTAVPKSQAEQTPDANSVRQNQSGAAQGGGSPGVAGTFLTGSGGVDPNALKLGKSTLLGA